MARKPAKSRASKATPPKEVAFDFVKSPHFRTVSVDGAFGGISPQGRSLHMAVFGERHAIPTKVVHHLIDGTHLGSEIENKREARSAIVRELEVDLVMDYATAMAMLDWLSKKTDEMRALLEARKMLRRDTDVSGE